MTHNDYGTIQFFLISRHLYSAVSTHLHLQSQTSIMVQANKHARPNIRSSLFTTTKQMVQPGSAVGPFFHLLYVTYINFFPQKRLSELMHFLYELLRATRLIYLSENMKIIEFVLLWLK